METNANKKEERTNLCDLKSFKPNFNTTNGDGVK
jgi:hypothetical protein